MVIICQPGGPLCVFFFFAQRSNMSLDKTFRADKVVLCFLKKFLSFGKFLQTYCFVLGFPKLDPSHFSTYLPDVIAEMKIKASMFFHFESQSNTTPKASPFSPFIFCRYHTQYHAAHQVHPSPPNHFPLLLVPPQTPLVAWEYLTF